MSNVGFERRLRQESDAFLRSIDRLTAMEREKRELAPGSQRFVELARLIEEYSRQLVRTTERQEELAVKSAELAAAGDGVDRPIEDIEPSRDVAVILAEWREAERRLAQADPESAQASAAIADVRRLRAEYRRTSLGSPG